MALTTREDLNVDRSRDVHLTEDRTSEALPGQAGRWASIDHRLGWLHEAALRALDLLVALVGLFLAAPLLSVVSVAIKLDSPGPVFYRQLRVGRARRRRKTKAKHGGPSPGTGDPGTGLFVIYKLRTMHMDAEADSGPTWSSPGDDRTTRVGRFLRRHRLDELPQLYNVLRGDMAIVGPRPERPVFYQRLREEIEGYALRQGVRPGITGWAQVNRAADQTVKDVEHKLQYDLEYLERRSLWFNARIMLRTPLVMMRPDLVAVVRDEDAGKAISGDGEPPGILTGDFGGPSQAEARSAP